MHVKCILRAIAHNKRLVGRGSITISHFAGSDMIRSKSMRYQTRGPFTPAVVANYEDARRRPDVQLDLLDVRTCTCIRLHASGIT